MGLSIIVPAYNEGGNIQQALVGVDSAAYMAGLSDYEIIVVDDGSTDHTAKNAHLLAQQLDHVRVIQQSPNQGLRAAYETGLHAATKEYVTWVPGDGEMATESLAAIFKAIGTTDLVVPFHGTPERRPWFRRLLTWGSTSQLNWLLGHSLNYFQGTVVLPTSLARSLPRTIPGFFCMAEQLCHALELGYSYVEVPLEHQERTYGVSKAVSFRKILDGQMAILNIWWRLKVQRDVQGLQKQATAEVAYAT